MNIVRLILISVIFLVNGYASDEVIYDESPADKDEVVVFVGKLLSSLSSADEFGRVMLGRIEKGEILPVDGVARLFPQLKDNSSVILRDLRVDLRHFVFPENSIIVGSPMADSFVVVVATPWKQDPHRYFYSLIAVYSKDGSRRQRAVVSP